MVLSTMPLARGLVSLVRVSRRVEHDVSLVLSGISSAHKLRQKMLRFLDLLSPFFDTLICFFFDFFNIFFFENLFFFHFLIFVIYLIFFYYYVYFWFFFSFFFFFFFILSFVYFVCFFSFFFFFWNLPLRGRMAKNLRFKNDVDNDYSRSRTEANERAEST